MIIIRCALFIFFFIGFQFRACYVYADSEPVITGTGLPITSINFEITGVDDSKDKWLVLAKSLIPDQEGELFFPQKLKQLIAALSNSKLFVVKDVRIREYEQKSIALYFLLELSPRIQDIQIKGNFPVFEQEVLNTMTIFTGDVFQKEALPEQKQAILHLLKNEGYISPSVSIFSIKDEDSGHHVVHVDIDKGEFFHVKQLEIKGNQSFSDFRLMMRLNTWKSSFLPGGMSRYQKKNIADDVKNLTEFYHEKQFADVKVTPRVEKNSVDQEVKVIFMIDEGPLYKIEFIDNNQFWDWTLRKDLILFKEGNRKEIGLRKSIRNIRDRYFKEGYADCRIKIEEVPNNSENRNVRKINFKIQEGLQSIVRKIRIVGNQVIQENEIRNQILTRPPEIFSKGVFVKQTMDDDIRSMVSLYLKQGYPYVKIKDKILWSRDEENKMKFADIRLTVSEGPGIMVSSIYFKGLTAISEINALQFLSMKPGEPFREYMVRSDANSLAARISEKGFPYVTVSGKIELHKERGKAAITYDISEGSHVKMGKIHTVGNFRTRKKIIERELVLEEGKPFSMYKMLETQRNIRNINALKSAKIDPLGLREKNETVHLLVEVEEKKPYSFEASLGYDTSRRLYANTRLGDLNLLGMNKESWIGLEASQIGERGEIGLTEPRFFSTRISSTIKLFGEQREEFNKSFGTKTYGTAFLLKRKLPDHFSTSITISYERKQQYLRTDESISIEEKEIYEPRGIVVVSPSVVYDSVDSFIRPRKGAFSSFAIDVSKGIENSLDDFLKYQYEIKFYQILHKRLTLAFRGRVGHIEPFGEGSNIPEDQLFFLGGLSSVRGYDENSLMVDATGEALGGRTEFLGSVEARFDIGFQMELAPFFDTGSVQNFLTDDDSDKFRSSYGISLRYFTPYCPIGLQYGHKLDKKNIDDDAGKFYFTVGYTF